MTKPLSPAAQAVLDAFAADSYGVWLEGDPDRIAAALRAAVHQLNKRRWAPGVHWARMELLAIADELEGQ